MIYGSFEQAIKAQIRRLVYSGSRVRPNNWQSMDVSQKREAEMRELLGVQFQVMMPQAENMLDVTLALQEQIEPNLPWADNHFWNERVSGEPINPGRTWKDWPWSNSADTFRDSSGQFDHSYAERYWPKFAGYTHNGEVSNYDKSLFAQRMGIRDPLGDLDDIIDRIEQDHTTRQAVLTVWFPEDQTNHGRRVPCSLNYQFLYREGYLHVLYNIRSCDAFRHFRDDLYLTAQLVTYVISRLRKKDPTFYNDCVPGIFTMSIGSFHCFVNDIPSLERQLS